AYSNTNYLILGKIIERKMGMPWSQIVDQEIAHDGELKMSDTGVYDLSQVQTSYAIGYVDPLKKSQSPNQKVTQATYRDPEILTAVGDMYSTAWDLFRWEHYLFNS